MFFDDINFNEEPVNLSGAKFDWPKIAERLQQMVRSPAEVFKSYPIEIENVKTKRNENPATTITGAEGRKKIKEFWRSHDKCLRF